MNIPKQRRTYCRKCNKHTIHKVTQYKKGKDSLTAQGKGRFLMNQASAATTPSKRVSEVRPSPSSARRPRPPRRSCSSKKGVGTNELQVGML